MTERSQTRWTQRLLRLSLRVFWMLIFAAFLTGVYLWHVPLSPKALQEAVRKRLEQVTGAEVRFEAAPPRLLIPDRRLEVRNVAFYSSAESASPDFRLGSIDVTFARGALLSPNSPDAVERITLGEPTRIVYTYAPDGVHPSASARFLARTLERIRQTTGSATGQIRIDHIEIALREEIAPGAQVEESANPPEILLRGELTANTSRASGTAASFEGGIDAGGVHSSLSGILAAHGPTSRTLDLTLGPLNIPVPLPGKTARLSAASGAHLRLDLSQEGVVVAVRGSADLPEFELEVPQIDSLKLSDRNVALRLDGDYDMSGGTYLVRDGRFSSELVGAEVSGSGSAHEPHSFEMRTTATRLGGSYRALLERLLPPGYELEAPDDGFRLTALAAGDRHSLTALEGSLSFTSVTLASPALPRRLRNLRGDIDFRPELIALRSVSATSGRSDLRLDGTLAGDYLRGGDALLTLDWSASATTPDLARLLTSAAPSEPESTADSAPSGMISGSGSLRQQISLRAPASQSMPPEISGTIRLADVDFASPGLPADLKALNGTLTVQGDRVRMDSLSATVGGTPVSVRGIVAGNRYFWRDPVLSATVATRLDLARLPDSLPAELRSAAERYKLKGQADARLQISAALDRLADPVVTGVVAVKEGEAQIALPDSQELSLRAAEGSLSWDGSALILDRFAAHVNGEPLTAQGFASSEQIAIDTKGMIELAAIARTVPAAANWVELSGPAEIDLRLREKSVTGVVANHYTDARAGGSDGPASAVLNLVHSIGPRMVTAASGGKLDLNGSVVLGKGKTGARLRHNAMPGGTRRNEQGRLIPQAELANVRGRVILSGNTLSTPHGAPLTCDLADTKNCKVEATVQLRPGNFPKMTVRATSRAQAKFDTWMTGWGKLLPVPPEPPDTGRTFELDLNFAAPSAIYKGQPAGQTRLELSYSLLHRPNSPRRTLFKRLEVSGGARGGNMIASGEMLSYVWKPDDYPRWTAEAQFQRMPMLPLLTWIFRDVRNIDGYATGRVSVQGVKDDALRVQGTGSTQMTDLIIDRTSLIQGLARATGRQFRGRRFSSVDTTNFTISDGALSSRDLNLDSAGGLLLEMRGRYFFADVPRYGVRARTIDARMRLKIFQSMLQQLPIISGIPLVGELAGGVTQLADQVAGAFLLAFQVSGPADQPQITPIALPLFQGGE